MPIQPIRASYSHNLFTLNISHLSRQTRLTMILKTHIVNTRDIPETYGILKVFLPTVLKSQCFNELGFSFRREVRSTEIGHLFEHILLEYLCIQKIARGGQNACYSGVTEWNWKKDQWGTFHIQVNAGLSDLTFFDEALTKSIQLLGMVLKPIENQQRYQQFFSAPVSMVSVPLRIPY